MKRFLLSLFAIACSIVPLSAMNYEEAQEQAYYLSDKMAYELDLTDEQFELVYQINLDYILSVDDDGDPYGRYADYRNEDLKYVLTVAQYEVYEGISYFVSPISLSSGGSIVLALLKIYASTRYFFDRPSNYSSYKGSKSYKSRTKEKASPYKGKKPIQNAKSMNEKAGRERQTVSGRSGTRSKSASSSTSSKSASGQWQYPNAGSSSTGSSNTGTKAKSSGSSTSKSKSSASTSTKSNNTSTSKSSNTTSKSSSSAPTSRSSSSSRSNSSSSSSSRDRSSSSGSR